MQINQLAKKFGIAAIASFALLLTACNQCNDWSQCCPQPATQCCPTTCCPTTAMNGGVGARGFMGLAQTTDEGEEGKTVGFARSFGFAQTLSAKASSNIVVAQGCAPCDPCAPGSNAVARTPSSACRTNVVTINTDHVRVTKQYPAGMVDLNQEFPIVYTVTALDNAENIQVTETIPSGVVYVRGDVNGAASGDSVVWTIDSLSKGQSKVIRTWFKATQVGQICGCTTVTATPCISACICVGEACIECSKTAPPKINCDDWFEYTITVKNTGTAVARDVVVTENLPSEVEHPSGQRVLRFNLGDICPKECKQFNVRVKAKTRCIHVCNTITTTSSNCESSSCECCVDICKQIVSIRKSGPAEQFVCKNADYQLVIRNEGDNPLHDVVVTDFAPQGTCIVSAPGASLSGNTATWCCKVLNPGEERVFNIRLTARNCGVYCNRASVRAADGCGTDTELCTTWKGCSGITMCVTDCQDPICVGECNTYKIVVVNQGSVPDTNVSIVANFSPELLPISGCGPTCATVSGQTVTFKPIASLPAKQTAEFTIRAKGVSSGDARLKVDLMADFLTKPVTDEESTQVY